MRLCLDEPFEYIDWEKEVATPPCVAPLLAFAVFVVCLEFVFGCVVLRAAVWCTPPCLASACAELSAAVR